MKTYTWTTEKGAVVELTIENNKAVKFIVGGNEMKINLFKTSESNFKSIFVTVGRNTGECAIPLNVKMEITQEQIKNRAAKEKSTDQKAKAKRTLRNIELQSGEEAAIRRLER
jgi:hypothetical protein